MNLTEEQIAVIENNTCIHCGNIVNEDLRKWFKQKWVNIGKKKKGGGHPECGTSGEKRGYAKCVPASKAAGMTKKQKTSAVRRKRAAQNKAGRGGTSSIRGGGKKPIRVKTKAENVMNLEELVGKPITEAQFDEAAGKKDACYHKVKARYDVWPSAYASGALVKCRKVGAKNWGNKSKKEYMDTMAKKRKRKGLAPVKESYDVWDESCGYTFEFEKQPMEEAEYKGRDVKLNKPMQGDTKKFKVYVKNNKGNVVKVNFGHKGKGGEKTMRIKKSNPERRKAFRARHNCDNPGPKYKARYWSCRKW